MQFDLIIVGGGLVGAGFAAALRDSGLRIALVDARRPSSDDPRLFALNEGSCQFLKNLHLWPAFAAHAAPIHHVHVSYHKHFGAVRLDREEVKASSLGHVIPARFIEAALNDALLSLPNFTLYRPAKLKTLQQHNGQVELTVETLEGELTLTAPIVIAADGTDSTVRAQLGIAVDCVDYKQSAIVTRTTLQRSHQHIAYERFNAQGAIAMLPLVGNECATIWSADDETVGRLMTLPDDVFLQTLQKEFGYRLGRLLKISQRHVFPLRMVRAEKAVEQGVFLLGNAAHTLHPIAAQGFNLALYEVAVLAESILDKRARQASFTPIDLQQISEQIQQQQTTSIGISHHLTTLFSKHSMMKHLLLPLGMMGLDGAGPLKKRFIQGAMGKTGRVPRLLMSTNSYDQHF